MKSETNKILVIVLLISLIIIGGLCYLDITQSKTLKEREEQTLRAGRELFMTVKAVENAGYRIETKKEFLDKEIKSKDFNPELDMLELVKKNDAKE